MSVEAVDNNVIEEPIKKTSKLKRIGSTVAVAGVYGLWIGGAVGSAYVSYRIVQMNLETAKLQLEAAANAAQK